jgi:hypothetical protein
MRLSHLFIFITSALFLVSCGATKSTSSLKVSFGMAAANKSYKGGLVFYGKSSTGKIFSLPVPYNVNAPSNQVDIDLDFGTWTFAAVSWDGGVGTPKFFRGNSTCALIKDKVIDSNQVTVNLTLESSTCSDADFGTSFSSGSFKKLGIVTCGTFWKDFTTTPLSPLAIGEDNPDYCDTTNPKIPPDLKKWAKAAHISVPVMIPGQPISMSSPLSVCLPLNEGKSLSNLESFPEDGLPLQVILTNSNCAEDKKITARYVLERGFSQKYPLLFDSRTSSNSNVNNLYLLSTLSRRGISSLIDSMPNFQCHSSDPCIKIPNSFAKYVEPERDFYVKDFQQGDACSNISSSIDILLDGSPITTFDNAQDCQLREGRFYIRLKSDDFVNSCSATPGCYLSVNLNSTATTFYIMRSPDTLDGVSALSAYELIFRALGHEDTISYPLNWDSLNAYNSFNMFYEDKEGEKYFGMLSHIRQMFAPDAIGGLLYNVTASSLAGKDFNFSIWDDGTQKPFNLKVESNSETIPNYINNGATNYTHKLTLSQIQGGAKIPFQVIRWAYGKKIGMSEVKFVEVDSNKNEKRVSRNLFYWNTESIHNSRFELYGSEDINENTTPFSLILRRTNFVRAEREATIDEGNARIDQYSYESRKNGSVFNERASKQSIQLNDLIALFKESQASFNNATSSGDYFNKDYFKQFNKSEAPSNDVSFAVSPDGTQKVWGWSEYISSSWNLRVALKLGTNAPVSFFTFDLQSTQPIVPRLSINNGGQVGVAGVTVLGNPLLYNSFVLIYNNSAWTDSTSTMGLVVNSETISDISLITNHSDQLVIDIVDDDPSAENSDKFVVYSRPFIGFTTSWYIDFKVWDSNSSNTNKWTNSSQLMDLSLKIPYEIYFSKANNNNFYLTYFYNDGTTTEFNVGKVTNQGGSNYFGSGNVNSGSPQSLDYGVSLVTSSFNSSNGSMDLFLSNNNKYTFSVSPNISLSASTSLGANYMADFKRQNYCFVRSMSSSEDLGAENTFGNDPKCKELKTSYEPPIKSKFKFNLETLNPSNFNSIFTQNF